LVYQSTTVQLAQPVYELLDADSETVCLTGELAIGPAWAGHLDYRQGLPGTGEAMLARVCAEVSP